MDDSIGGPYKFGDHPPPHRFGWLGARDEAESYDKAYKAGYAHEFEEVEHHLAGKSDNPGVDPDVHVWHLEEELLGSYLPLREQLGPDCVAAAVCEVVEKHILIESREQGDEDQIPQRDNSKRLFRPYVYGVSRNQILGGLNGGGSTGAAGARAVAEYGSLYISDAGVPSYSSSCISTWGNRSNVNTSRCVYAKFYDVAKPRKVKIARLTTVEQVHAVLRPPKRRMVTIASNRGFRMQPRSYKGMHVWVPSGSWSHQMHIVAEIIDPISAVYLQNQWGSDAHGRPLNGEYPGGAWLLDDDLDNYIRNASLYAYYEVIGDPVVDPSPI